MVLRHRIARLERGARAREPSECASCGLPRGGEVGVVQWHVEVPRALTVLGEPEPEPDTSNDVCSACGRRLVFRVPSPRALGRDEV